MLLGCWFHLFSTGWDVSELYWNQLRHINSLPGEGRIISINDADSPPAYPVLTLMNYEKETLRSVLSTLNWATVQEDYAPGKYLLSVVTANHQ